MAEESSERKEPIYIKKRLSFNQILGSRILRYLFSFQLALALKNFANYIIQWVLWDRQRSRQLHVPNPWMLQLLWRRLVNCFTLNACSWAQSLRLEFPPERKAAYIKRINYFSQRSAFCKRYTEVVRLPHRRRWQAVKAINYTWHLLTLIKRQPSHQSHRMPEFPPF